MHDRNDIIIKCNLRLDYTTYELSLFHIIVISISGQIPMEMTPIIRDNRNALYVS